jgi:hypothetical protein
MMFVIKNVSGHAQPVWDMPLHTTRNVVRGLFSDQIQRWMAMLELNG